VAEADAALAALIATTAANQGPRILRHFIPCSLPIEYL
jgi:hypothetical protein